MSDTLANAIVEEEDHRNRPKSRAFVDFVTSNWAPRADLGIEPSAASAYTPARRASLSARFPGARLVIPAGPYKVRSNDTDYRFRPHSAFAHLTGLGMDQEPDAVLVLHPVASSDGHAAALYLRPLADRDNEEFYADSRYGEFWVGARPSLADMTTLTGIEARHIDRLPEDLGAGLDMQVTALLVIEEADPAITALVADIVAVSSSSANVTRLPKTGDAATNADLLRATAELRLIKDEWEIAEMRSAVAQTVAGFEDVVRALPRATRHWRGERVIENAFENHARLDGNGVGYDTIAAAGENATILHWIRNDGPVRDGDVVLLDAGIETDSLYTADVTRTMPVTGKFTDVQRRIYQAVLDAADAAFAAARPGARFIDVHNAAMAVIAARLEEWGLLPNGVTAAQTLDEQTGGEYRRWMVHGTSHHLGIDVHDCAQARNSLYREGVLEPGMIFTIEPGLYFKSDDLAVPEEYRGIGIRIEDDVLLTEDGCENLSAALPRTVEGVEAWMAGLLA
ncbi:MAG: aminopeptidase P family protein [Promicromonosporaceae bacterium]|nr:aminopeptidase P family protein [Promicromonosporaceae bacterium]